MNPTLKYLIFGGVLCFTFLIVKFGWVFLLGFAIGFILANLIFFSNNPTILSALRIITGGRESNIKSMLESDIQNEKRTKVKYRN